MSESIVIENAGTAYAKRIYCSVIDDKDGAPLVAIEDGYDPVSIKVDKWPEVKSAIDKLIAERGEV